MADSGGYRIGIDTGGTFTDVVAVRAGDGAVFSAKVPSTPSDPTQALDAAIRTILELTGAAPDEVSALIHGTTEATNALLGRQDHNMCLIVTEGFRHILEISCQNAPDGFGDSFFWVKPQRLVTPDRVYEVSARMDHRGVELAPLDEELVRDMVYLCKKREIEAAGICLLHSYANPAHELRLREIFAEEHPDCHVSLSCEVLPEHQEYERAVTTLLDAACKPVLKSYLDRAIERVAGDLSGSTPFFIMKSNGGITSARRAAASPLQTAASGPAAGVHACAAMAAQACLRKIITLDAGGTSTDVSVVEEGVPSIAARSKLGIHTVRVPMVDILTAAVGSGSVAWISRDGSIRVGPRSAGADPGPMCYGKGGDEPTVADAQCFLGFLPDHLAGGEIALDRGRAEEGIGRIAEKLKNSPEEAAKGILEIAAWNQAQAIRQLTVQRGKDPREYSLVAFGGAGPIMAAGIAGALGASEVIVPPLPGCLSARGLIGAGLRNDYVKTHVAPLEEASGEGILTEFESMQKNAETDLGAENILAEDQVFSRSMDLRYAGEGHEMTIELPAGEPLAGAFEGAAGRFHEAHRLRFGFDHEGRAPVEVVNLRLTAEGGSNHRGAPGLGAPPGQGAESAAVGVREVYFEGMGFVPTPLYDRTRLGGGDVIEGPAIVEDFGAAALVPPGSRCTVDEWGNLRIAFAARAEAPGGAGPVVLEIIEGALVSAEREMEELLGRTARSPLIRDMHDFGVGLFDPEGRKITGRSFSAEAEPVLKNWKREEIREGDVFAWNDPYLSGGGIGHLPDLCLCAPVFHGGELTAFSLVFAHLADIGGAVPGSLPAGATDAHQEGLLIPPIKLYEGGAPNETAHRIIIRNSRFPAQTQADIGAALAACRTGVARIADLCGRFGREVVLASFGQLIEKCARTIREELFRKIPDGTWECEDYIESDGVTPKKAHMLKLRMTKAGEKLTLDFRGTSPQAAGPINWPGDRAGGRFLKKWLGAALRPLADSYERMFEIGINEGICDLIDIEFPEPGSLITPLFPAPTNMGVLTLFRLLGLFSGVLGLATRGRMPADQEGLRYWGIRGGAGGEAFLFREILGGGSGGRSWADGEDAIHILPGCLDLPAEIIESRFPVRVERMGLVPDSGGAGKRRGGLGYFKELRVLCDCEVFSQGDRAAVGPWGVAGGRPGGVFGISVNPGTPAQREVPAISDGTKVIEGDLVRVETTGGGGWGNPFEREYQYVRRDVIWEKVTFDGAMRHYGVVFSDEKNFKVDPDGSGALRQIMKAARKKGAFFDRGPGFAALKSSAAGRLAAG